MGRKVIGIGETVLDIIFKNHEPQAAKPGGSTFNALVSLGRTGVPATFISDIGNDKVGDIIVDFLHKNHINTDFLNRHDACKTSLALAFLNEKNDAEYEFYKDYLNQNPHTTLPEINQDDIILFGSFYAINPNIRPILKSLLEKAKKNNAIIYYDPNFRSSHLHELDELKATILENMEYATVVRGSDEDFQNIFGLKHGSKVYNKVSAYCKNLIVTKNENGVDVVTPNVQTHAPAQKLTPLSTIGAGDSFNAGFIYAIIHNKITFAEIQQLSKMQWQKLAATAIQFSTAVCKSYDNYVPENFKPEKN